MKVIALDQRTGEEAAVAEYPDDAVGSRQAGEHARVLQEKALADGRDFMRYWVAD